MKIHSSGSWNADTNLQVEGGQSMKFNVMNTNVLGSTLTIQSNLGGTKSLIIPPLMSMDFEFTCFGAEPISWSFDIATKSDAFIVTWILYSTWVPGDPANG
ncbi:MAG: hypothetical protein WKF91_22920 [Segetibacter sp.]